MQEEEEEEAFLKEVTSVILTCLKKQYSGPVEVNVFSLQDSFQVELKLTRGINFDLLSCEVNSADNDVFNIKPDCTNLGGYDFGIVRFFINVLL